MAEDQIFKAYLVEESEPGQFTRRVSDRNPSDVGAGEVLVRVKYSSLNYKDALSAAGNRGVTKKYPHVPGIDAAGVVEESESTDYKRGDEVIIVSTGDFGVNSPGGFEQYVRVPADWLVPLPRGLTLRQSMVYGTAGFTAALSVAHLEQAGILPSRGEVLVTGATGGVGSVAVGILAKDGYQVIAATGKVEHHKLLRALGAKDVISREEINDTSGKPLLHARWAGVIDTVGGNYLATAIRSTQPGGVVTACGNAASGDLPLTVYPFILRGIDLLGIDATRPTHEERLNIWKKLAKDWKLKTLDELAREVSLDQLDPEIQRILQGGQIGRVVVNLEQAKSDGS